MGTTYRYLTTIEDAAVVPAWFRDLPEQPVESAQGNSSVFHFLAFGPLSTDWKKSPVVSVFLPTRKRGVLTTIGEVHFLATPLSAFPGLNRINKLFRLWLSANQSVYSHGPDFVHEWDYYLEGSAKNWDSDVFALPKGMQALQNGSYFVSMDDNDFVLDRICQSLDLRGVEGIRG